MKVFSYHRKSQPLSSVIRLSNVSTGVVVVIFIALFFVLPSPWNWTTLVSGLLVNAYLIFMFVKILGKRHRLGAENLHLAYGQFEIDVPLSNLAGAELFQERPPEGLQIARFLPDHHGEKDTLYLLSDSLRLVELTLKEPTRADVPGKGLAEFTKVVLSLDEPDEFLAALKEQWAAE